MTTLNLGMYDSRLSGKKEELEKIFANCNEVQLHHISKSPSGHGHYRVNLYLIINGVCKDFTSVITNMTIIDEWNDEDGNITCETIMYVIEKFEDRIDDFVGELKNAE